MCVKNGKIDEFSDEYNWVYIKEDSVTSNLASRDHSNGKVLYKNMMLLKSLVGMKAKSSD